MHLGNVKKKYAYILHQTPPKITSDFGILVLIVIPITGGNDRNTMPVYIMTRVRAVIAIQSKGGNARIMRWLWRG